MRKLLVLASYLKWMAVCGAGACRVDVNLVNVPFSACDGDSSLLPKI